MKKSFVLAGIVALLSGAAVASAAPLARQSVGELLGLRPGSTQSFGSQPALPVFRAPAAVATADDAASGDAVGVTIGASVVFPDNAQGMWSYNTTSWNPTRLSVNPEILATGGGIAAPNGYYYVNRYREMMGFEEINTLSYKMSDWSEYDKYTGQINYVATTMAYSPTRDEVFGCFINEERTGYNFVKWDYDNYRPKVVICAIERPWSGCAFSKDGTLYAIERNGDLYKVNLKTGAMTLVGSTGVTSTYLVDATIDTDTDTMYWSVSTDDEQALYAVDITNAHATKVYDLANGEQLCGMYIPFKAVETPAGAPAKVTSISPSFSGSSLTGKVNFNMPNYTFGQTALDKAIELDYTVYANGVEVAAGKGTPGVRVTTAEFTLPEADSYYFTVVTANEAGKSPVSAGYHKYVGPDTPKAPSSFTLKIADKTVTLSWNSPSSSGINGGSVNYSAATYTVTRYPDGKVVADNVTTRTATDELPNPEVRTDYYYVLQTTVEGLQAPDVKSASIGMGPITAPYTATFTAGTDIAGWTILDVNDDNTKWTYSSSYKAMELYGSKGHNDWLITPAVKVKAGTSYPIAVTMKTSSYYDEKFEVMWGTAPTAEAMTNTAIAETTFKSTADQTFEGEITGAPTGTIYIGVHGMSGTPSNTLRLVSLTIESGQTAAAPAAPANFEATSPVDGTLEATISFNVPRTDLAGQPLEGDNAVTKVEILRDGNVIATITEGIEAGALIEYTDRAEDLTAGKHVYGALAYNAFGDGTVAEKEILVGARKPVAPASALMLEDRNSGMVTISWEPVTTDVEGNTIKEGAVTYRVIDRQYNTVAEGVTETSVTLRAVEEGKQAFCQFGVYAVTAGGESAKMAATAYKPVGTPYAAPWAESFANREVSSIFGFNYIKGNEPWQFVSSHDWGFTSQDDDNGFAMLEAYGDLTALVTGKIDLTGLTNPAFIYYTYNHNATYRNSLEVQVDNGDGRGFVPVQEDVVADVGPEKEWNKVIVPLDDYEGQSIIIRIEPKNLQMSLYTLDNLRVTTNAEYNLVASRLVTPNAVDANKPFEVSVVVSNNGDKAINSYQVELLNGETMIDHAECQRIQPGEVKTVTFETTLTVNDGEYASLQGNVVCDVDEIESDNVTDVVKVGIITPLVPVAAGLTAENSTAGVVLTWTAPDMSTAAPNNVTETFDTAESWSSTVAGWKFVDQDKAPFGGINTDYYPCTGLQSWYVADRDWSGFIGSTDPDRWNGHSGKRFLVSGYVMRSGVNVQSDDWAITPRLWAESHAMSFYAKSFDPMYLETFEVLASAGTTSVDDFERVGYVIDVPNAWTQYRFKLPAGTKYAAIRSRSINKYLLFVDDVTYVPAEGAPAQHVLKGYHVYRNGQRITDQPVQGETFTDPTASEGYTHTYHVTAVFERGESRPSEQVQIATDFSGIGSIATGDVTIDVKGNTVTVTGLTDGNVTVAAMDGRIVAMRRAAPRVTLTLTPGAYIVTAGQRTVKAVM